MFHHLANTIFAKGLDYFPTVYLDNILIYSPTKDQHERDIRWTFERLHPNNLYAKRKKCDLTKQEVEYLGQIIKDSYMLVDPTKTEAL